MGGITEKIAEFIKEILRGWIEANLTGMFTDLNEKVGTIADEVGRTPQTWNGSIFNMVRGLSETVMIPIAGMVISAVLCYELVSMVMEKNNMHEFDTGLFFRYLFKAALAAWLHGNCFDMTMAVFDVGSHAVSSAGQYITGTTSLDVETALKTMFENSIDLMGIGELLGLGMETMFLSFAMKIMSVLITVILYGRIIEIYLYILASPIPFATWTNREWGTIGSNYFKSLFALAFQGFFIMVCVGIYAVLVSGVSVAGNIHSAFWSVAAYTVVLCFSLFKTGSLSRSIFNAH